MCSPSLLATLREHTEAIETKVGQVWIELDLLRTQLNELMDGEHWVGMSELMDFREAISSTMAHLTEDE